MIIGKIFERANVDEFVFVANKYFQASFVEVKMEHISKEAKIIGEIIHKEAINPYFSKATTINYIITEDETIKNQSLYVTRVKPLALIQNGKLSEIELPPLPGSNVLIAEDDDVRLALGLEREGLEIGQLKGQENMPVRISSGELFRTHFSILGRTGSGKSYFAKGLTKKLFSDESKRCFIIISPTDEYNELAEELGCRLITKSDISLPFNTSYLASIYGLNMQEKTFLERFMKYFKQQPSEEPLSNVRIAERLEKWCRDHEGRKRKTKSPQLSLDMGGKEPAIADQIDEFPKYADSTLSKIRQKNLFFSTNPLKVPFNDSTIMNISDFAQASQEIILSYVLSNLLESYRKNRGKNTLIIIEEIHNYAPSVQSTLCKDKIVQVAREGRKLGLSLGLISQRPRHFDQTVLSQCGSLFLFQIPHPDDVDHVFGISPVYSSEMISIIRKLRVGECLLLGDIVKYPIVAQIVF